MTDPLVAVYTFEGISAFHLGVPALIFGEDRRQLGVPRFNLIYCSDAGDATAVSNGLALPLVSSLDRLAIADIVIIPSWPDTLDGPSPELKLALEAAHAGVP